MGTRALPLISDSLNAMLGSPLTVELKTVEVTHLSEAKAGAARNHAMIVASSPMSSDALVMLMDCEAIALLISAFFGGDPDLPVTPIERDLSPTEIDVATMVFQEVARSVNGWGARALDINFPLPTAISGTDLERRILRDGPAVRLIFAFSAGSAKGTLSLMMPQRVLMQRAGLSGTDAEQVAASGWRARISEEVMRSTVTLEATMPLGRMSLGDIAGLREGQIIELAETAQSSARLSARKKTLFLCEFGKLGQNYTVRINQPCDAGREFIDGLLPK